MPKRRSGTADITVARSRTGASRKVLTQEAFDERRINVGELVLFSLEPESKMGKAAQIDSYGAIGISLASKYLDVGCYDVLEWAINQPVVANKMGEYCIGGHGLLL